MVNPRSRILHRAASLAWPVALASGCGGEVAPADGGWSPSVDAGIQDVTALPDAVMTAFDSAAMDTTAADASSAADSRGDEGVCTPGATRCSGSSVETCLADQRWGAAAPCSQPAPDCAAGVCTCQHTACPGACADLQTDNANCGGCGLACSTTCTAGECIVILESGQQGASDIAVDSTSVYWSTTRGIMKASLDGGAVTTLSTTDGVSIALDSTRVYWLSAGFGGALSVTIDGGTPITYATLEPIGTGIAVDSTSVYWTMSGGTLKASLSGGPPITLASEGTSQGVAVGTSSVYWTTSQALLDVALDGGTPATFATGQGLQGITVAGANVYWTDRAGGNVMSAPIAGGAPTTLVSGQTSPGAIAVDGTSVYWSSWVQPTLARIPVGGGAPVTLAALLAEKIAVDSTSVYLASNGEVIKVTPK